MTTTYHKQPFKPYLTYIFVIIMVGLFLLMELSGGSENTMVLLQFGAKERIHILAGQYYRFVTPIFLHIGILHLIMNGVIVYYLGRDLEHVYGHWKYFFVFIASGIVGNIFSFAFNNAVSAGASTAIFGLFASVLVLAKSRPNNSYLQALARNYLVLVIINIIFNLFSPGVDLAGHLGGLVGGYFSTAVIVNTDRKNRIIHLSLGLILVAIVLYVGFTRPI